MDARNYLYLWVYAHHKVIYYANFLIPILSKELAELCGKNIFPSWELDYNNIDKLDDYYIWTAIKFARYDKLNKCKLKSKIYADLIDQLLSRRYFISLYKSLAEFELVFASYTDTQKAQALKKLFKKVNKAKPFLENKGSQKDYLAGYINNEGLKEINQEIREQLNQFDIA